MDTIGYNYHIYKKKNAAILNKKIGLFSLHFSKICFQYFIVLYLVCVVHFYKHLDKCNQFKK